MIKVIYSNFPEDLCSDTHMQAIYDEIMSRGEYDSVDDISEDEISNILENDDNIAWYSVEKGLNKLFDKYILWKSVNMKKDLKDTYDRPVNYIVTSNNDMVNLNILKDCNFIKFMDDDGKFIIELPYDHAFEGRVLSTKIPIIDAIYDYIDEPPSWEYNGYWNDIERGWKEDDITDITPFMKYDEFFNIIFNNHKYCSKPYFFKNYSVR